MRTACAPLARPSPPAAPNLDSAPKRYRGEVAPADPDGQPDAAAPSAFEGSDGADLDDLYEDDEAFEDLDEETEGEPVETIDELGRRHIRRAAPEGTEQVLENEAPRHTGLSDRAERWRVRSATGTVLTAFAFGLKEVFEPNRNEPAIIMETTGDPPKELPVEAQLEPLGHRQSVVKVRPHLLGNNLPPGPAVVPSFDEVESFTLGEAAAEPGPTTGLSDRSPEAGGGTGGPNGPGDNGGEGSA